MRVVGDVVVSGIPDSNQKINSVQLDVAKLRTRQFSLMQAQYIILSWWYVCLMVSLYANFKLILAKVWYQIKMIYHILADYHSGTHVLVAVTVSNRDALKWCNCAELCHLEFILHIILSGYKLIKRWLPYTVTTINSTYFICTVLLYLASILLQRTSLQ